MNDFYETAIAVRKKLSNEVISTEHFKLKKEILTQIVAATFSNNDEIPDFLKIKLKYQELGFLLYDNLIKNAAEEIFDTLSIKMELQESHFTNDEHCLIFKK